MRWKLIILKVGTGLLIAFEFIAGCSYIASSIESFDTVCYAALATVGTNLVSGVYEIARGIAKERTIKKLDM